MHYYKKKRKNVKGPFKYHVTLIWPTLDPPPALPMCPLVTLARLLTAQNGKLLFKKGTKMSRDTLVDTVVKPSLL